MQLRSPLERLNVDQFANSKLSVGLGFRGFLSLISIRFENVGIGEFRLLAFVGSTVAFGLMHERWLDACLAGAITPCWFMARSGVRSDRAHMASNAAIASGQRPGSGAVAARRARLPREPYIKICRRVARPTTYGVMLSAGPPRSTFLRLLNRQRAMDGLDPVPHRRRDFRGR